ncbi:GNAT family acetyltransferase [Brachybacterium phenoliresistens]|uniref:GNAT family acetyltransferase n=1 Tax=Brachybacterium phenoliresistens TaxID=396014 RepID=Z9JQX6_9MICO|nr:GNAT family protein [Brachybacterium phenoliresistens]EWS80569.1 GNAT family acetyltransferase [Brachybacterium phenoliresistens]
MPHVWPLDLRDGDLRLRPLRRRDRREYLALRERNRDWLAPWDATDPAHPHLRPPFSALVRWNRRQGRSGTALNLVIVVDGALAGQVSLGPILHGAQSTATLGYWVDSARAGQGIAPRAAALMIDHCFAELGLHRVDVAIRPENSASRRVAEKLHMREEGLHRGLIHVDGAWRDHVSYALTAEEIPGHLRDASGRGVLERLRRER